jgi:hypothetical protein
MKATLDHMSKVKNPRDKKKASYARDRRNTYGENAKSSRKNIPRAKARVRRAERRVVRQALGESAGGADAEAAETTVANSRLQRLEGFKKSPDIPLGDYLARKRARKKKQES